MRTYTNTITFDNVFAMRKYYWKAQNNENIVSITAYTDNHGKHVLTYTMRKN